MPKTIVVHRFPRESSVTLHQVMQYIDDYEKEHPDRQVFFDGDRYAVCYVKK